MGVWRVNADTLAGGRFVVSPLAETIAALKTLERAAPAHPGERAWLAAHLPAYHAWQAADPVTALLVQAALGRTWNATFLTPTPDDETTFEQEVARVRDTPPDQALEDLTESLGGPVPAVLHRRDLPERMAVRLEQVWRETVLPTWPRRRGIAEADVVARTARLGQGGWAAALDGMRPGLRWLGGDRLQINTLDNPPRDLSGARLMFVPVTPRQGWVSWDGSRRCAIVYPCSGPLAETGPVPVPEALGRLLGPGRARVLVLVGTPKSTSHLVALTGQGLGSVGRHLKVLLDAGLVRRVRAGRSVLYSRTEPGDALVSAKPG